MGLRVPTSHQASGARAFLGTKYLSSPWPILCTLWVVEYISAVFHFAHTPCSVPDRRAQFYLPLLLYKHSSRDCVSWDVLKPPWHSSLLLFWTLTKLPWVALNSLCQALEWTVISLRQSKQQRLHTYGAARTHLCFYCPNNGTQWLYASGEACTN